MVYAIKAAGLAVAMGIGSSFIVLVSFTWGIFIFDEKIESRVGASFAILLMMAGLWGMSYYSSPKAQLLDMDHQSVVSRSRGYRGVHAHPSDTDDEVLFHEEMDASVDDTVEDSPPPDVVICGRKISQRRLGMAAAVFNGAWGGSIMVPMKFAP